MSFPHVTKLHLLKWQQMSSNINGDDSEENVSRKVFCASGTLALPHLAALFHGIKTRCVSMFVCGFVFRPHVRNETWTGVGIGVGLGRKPPGETNGTEKRCQLCKR